MKKNVVKTIGVLVFILINSCNIHAQGTINSTQKLTKIEILTQAKAILAKNNIKDSGEGFIDSILMQRYNVESTEYEHADVSEWNQLPRILSSYVVNVINPSKQLLQTIPSPKTPYDIIPISTNFCNGGNFEQVNLTNMGWTMMGSLRKKSTNPIQLEYSRVPTLNQGVDLYYDYIQSTTTTSLSWEIVGRKFDNGGAPIFTTRNINSLRALKLGSSYDNSGVESIVKKVKITDTNAFFSFWYALVLEDPGHDYPSNPFFGVRVIDGNSIKFQNILPSIVGMSSSPLVVDKLPFWASSSNNGIKYRDWTCGKVDLSAYIGKTIFVEIMVGDCEFGGHSGYAYIDDICFGCEGSDQGDIKIDSLKDTCNTNIFGSYSLPFGSNFIVDIDSITLELYQNQVKVSSVPSIRIPIESINFSKKTFVVNANSFLGYINTNRQPFDIVATAYFSLLKTIESYETNNLVVKSNINGSKVGVNNDWAPCCEKYVITDSLEIMDYSKNCIQKIKYEIDTSMCDSCKITRADLCTLINSFTSFKSGFATYPPNIKSCYLFDSRDSGYSCETDVKWYSIRYKKVYKNRIFYVKLIISSDCEIATCENYVCQSDAGKKINPFLKNIRGNYRPQQSMLYNIKRNALTSQNVRQGETYQEFSPLFNFGSWSTVVSPNWISKQVVTNYDEKGNEIENKNPLNIYSSSKFGYSKSVTTTVATNSKFREHLFLSFEEESYYLNSCDKKTKNEFTDFFLPNIGLDYKTGAQLSNDLGVYDEIQNVAFAHVIDGVAHSGKSSYLVMPYFWSNSPICYMTKASYLCGPQDPNVYDPTYATASDKVVSVNNSYMPNFLLDKEKDYLLSYWVKDADNVNSSVSYSDKGYIEVNYDCNVPTASIPIVKSKTIEGWSNIVMPIRVPQAAKLFKLAFKPNSNGTYYDDIRIFPFDANMKSYVYDPISLRLVAELDENNFATFYDYDDQGQLIRVRKETDRGIMTIKEHRTSLKQF